jgi:polysaccharide export outer membrane protein
VQKVESVTRWFGLVLFVAGCGTSYPPLPELQHAADAPYLVGPGDTLNVVVGRSPRVVRCSGPDGKITTPLVEDLQASGKTTTQLAREMEQVLSKYVQRPVVTVIVTTFAGPYSQQIRVIGEAAKPQALPYRENMTLLDVMIAVGGITDFAAGNRASILRTEGGKTFQFGVLLTDLIRAGDLRAKSRCVSDVLMSRLLLAAHAELVDQLVSYLRAGRYAGTPRWSRGSRASGWTAVHRIRTATGPTPGLRRRNRCCGYLRDRRAANMDRVVGAGPGQPQTWGRWSDGGMEAGVATPAAEAADCTAEEITITSGGRENLYTIAYADENREQARRVVESLLTIFMEGSIGNKRTDTDSARRFIEDQLRSYGEKLAAAENAVTEFKRRHQGLMPGEGRDYYGRLSDARTALRKASLELREAMDARDAIKRQLAGEANDSARNRKPAASRRPPSSTSALRPSSRSSTACGSFIPSGIPTSSPASTSSRS